MPNVMDMHRETVRLLGGYALTDKDRVATLHEALRRIADDCQTGEPDQATLVRIRRLAVAAVHATTHLKDPFPETAAVGRAEDGEIG